MNGLGAWILELDSLGLISIFTIYKLCDLRQVT